MKTIIEENVK